MITPAEEQLSGICHIGFSRLQPPKVVSVIFGSGKYLIGQYPVFNRNNLGVHSDACEQRMIVLSDETGHDNVILKDRVN